MRRMLVIFQRKVKRSIILLKIFVITFHHNIFNPFRALKNAYTIDNINSECELFSIYVFSIMYFQFILLRLNGRETCVRKKLIIIDRHFSRHLLVKPVRLLRLSFAIIRNYVLIPFLYSPDII